MATRQTGFLILSAVAVLLTAGCGTPLKAPFTPPCGIIVTSVKAPLQYNFHEGGKAYAKAYGEASSLFFQYYGSFAWDDCSVEKAARNGGLTNVSYADYETVMILGIFGKTTVRAYGTRTEQAHTN